LAAPVVSSNTGFLILLGAVFLISARFALWDAYAWGWGWRWSRQLKFQSLAPERRSERRGQLLRYLYDRSHGIHGKMIPAREIRNTLDWTMGELIATAAPMTAKGIELIVVEKVRWLVALMWRGHRLGLTAIGVLKVEEALRELGEGSHTVNITGVQGGVQVQVATIKSRQEQRLGNESSNGQSSRASRQRE
jgi:hypothetical protein